MRYNVYGSFLLACAFAVVAPMAARRVRPIFATWLLSCGAMVSATCVVGALGLCALTLAGDNNDVATRGHWSTRVFEHLDPVHRPVAIASSAALIVLVARAVLIAVRRHRALSEVRRSVSDIPAGGDLVVYASSRIGAFSIPGAASRVFISTAALRSLSSREIQALVSHERAHLRLRHYGHRHLVRLATALHPLPTGLNRAQEWVTERWADQAAARATSGWDVAAALRHVDDTTQGAANGLVLLAGASGVQQRIHALSRRQRGRDDVWLLLTGALLLMAVVTLLDAVTDNAALFHAAVSATHLRRSRRG